LEKFDQINLNEKKERMVSVNSMKPHVLGIPSMRNKVLVDPAYTDEGECFQRASAGTSHISWVAWLWLEKIDTQAASNFYSKFQVMTDDGFI